MDYAAYRRAVVAIAHTYIGGREQNNWGPLVELMLRNSGITVPAPWCAAFVQWCADQAKVALNAAGVSCVNPLDQVGLQALVRAYVQKGEQNGWIRNEPEPGDLFAWVTATGAGHIGFVEEVLPDGRIRTVEGNTNTSGGREGDGVYRRIRTPTAAYRFIRYEA